jgi:hypothetical protein
LFISNKKQFFIFYFTKYEAATAANLVRPKTENIQHWVDDNDAIDEITFENVEY